MGKQTKPGEIPSLDGWRAVAISIVFVAHAGWLDVVPGGLGVTIFFFLSGYLITTLMLREFAKTDSLDLRKFYVRRGLRLLPPLIIVLVVSYLLTYMGWLDGHATLQGFFAQLLYFSNYYVMYFDSVNAIPSGTGVYWSLAVEEHFYFLFPIVFLFVLARGTAARNLVLLYSFCAVELIWRAILVIGLHNTWERTYFATDARMDSIAFGCALAFIMNARIAEDWLKRDSTRRALIIAGVAGLLISLLWRGDEFRTVGRYSLQGLSLTPLFYYSVKDPGRWEFALLNTRAMKKIGVYSYSIYLTHLIVISNMELVIHRQVPMAIASAAVTVFLAWLIDRFVDQPLHKVRLNWRPREVEPPMKVAPIETGIRMARFEAADRITPDTGGTP